MVSAHVITTKKDITLPLQYVSEGDSVDDASLFGVTPSSPAYIAAGRVLEIDLNTDITDTPVPVLGSEDIIDSIKNEELFAFTVKSQIYNTNLLKYGINPCGAGVGSIDESLSFKFAKNLDGTEYFTKMLGARCASTNISLNMSAWEMDQTWICKDITTENVTDPDTTPTNVTSIPTTTIWRHQDTGASPFLWNSVNYPERSFSASIVRDLAILKVNGSSKILYSKPSNRSIEMSLDVVRSGTTLLTDYKNKTKRSASYEINDGTAQINFTNCVVTSRGERYSNGDNEAMMESITARAETATVVDT